MELTFTGSNKISIPMEINNTLYDYTASDPNWIPTTITADTMTKINNNLIDVVQQIMEGPFVNIQKIVPTIYDTSTEQAFRNNKKYNVRWEKNFTVNKEIKLGSVIVRYNKDNIQGSGFHI